MIEEEPYRQLQLKLGLAEALPYTENWSAAPDFLDIISLHCLENYPSTIVECSSGLTTLVLSRCCQLNKFGHVNSLEDSALYASKTQQQLKALDLQKFATVSHMPLIAQIVEQQAYDWYNMDGIVKSPIDMLVIDGPPGYIQPYSRYPAVPLLFDHLSDECVIFLDDAARDDEKTVVERWLRQYPELMHEYIDTERGCSVLRFRESE